MDKVWATIGVLAVVAVLFVMAILPNKDGVTNMADGTQSTVGAMDSIISDGNSVMGSTVMKQMSAAKNQGTGYLVSTGTLVVPTANGAVDFTDVGAYQTGKLYVVVNYLPTADGTFKQATDLNDIKAKGAFVEMKRFDANGKVNRITYTQKVVAN